MRLENVHNFPQHLSLITAPAPAAAPSDTTSIDSCDRFPALPEYPLAMVCVDEVEVEGELSVLFRLRWWVMAAWSS
jgi:hypothetical protein